MKKILLILMLFTLIGTANATEYTVCVGMCPAVDFSTIQDGINTAVNGDTVTVHPGVYYENINFNGKDILVRGKYSSGSTIDGGDTAPCVTFENSETSSAVLENFHLQNGLGAECPTNGTKTAGGGIFINGANPTIKKLTTSYDTHIVLYANNADHGRDIYAHNSSFELDDYEFMGSIVPVTLDDVCIYIEESTDVLITNGSVWKCALAITAINSTGTISHTEFDDVKAGAINLDDDSYFTILHCEFFDFTSTSEISQASVVCGNSYLTQNTFENNMRRGGLGYFPKGTALHILDDAKPVIHANVFTANTASYGTKAAAIYIGSDAAPVITSNLFEGNRDSETNAYWQLRGSCIIRGNMVGTTTDTLRIESNQFVDNNCRAGEHSSIIRLLMNEEAYLNVEGNIFDGNELRGHWSTRPGAMIQIDAGKVQFIGNQLFRDVHHPFPDIPCPKGVHFFARHSNTMCSIDVWQWMSALNYIQPHQQYQNQPL